MAKSLGELLQQTSAAMAATDYSEHGLMEMFPGIEPNEQERYKGMLLSYELAAKRMQDEQRNQRYEKRMRELTEPWDYATMKKKAIQAGELIGAANGFNFVIDEENEAAFHLLCLYFTGDEQFNEEGLEISGKFYPYSLEKGIWLQSAERGTGKSTLLQCFRINKRQCFGYQNVKKLAAMYQKGGYDAVDPYMTCVNQSPSPINLYQSKLGFMYDDLFTDNLVNYMGSPQNISQYIISSLYDFHGEHKRWMFHCTSNCDGKEIEQVAGKNFRSRMADMFNYIPLPGRDRRIKERATH